MKKILKTLGLQLGAFLILVLSLGIVYAAWDSTVNTGDQLTASSWNTLVGKVKNIDDTIHVNSNNVGIGTSSPSYELHVHSSSPGSGISITNGGNASPDGTTNGLFIGGTNENMYVANRENGFLSFWTNNTSRMTIQGNGNVGIGVLPGQARLYVAQTGDNPAIYATALGNHYGVYGESSQNYGVYGKTNSASYGGVLGYAANASTYGILGHANRYSLYGNGDIHVGGGIYLNTVPTSGTVHLCRDSTGYITYCSSDKRLKNNIQALHKNSVNVISKLKPVSFNWKENGRSDIGFVAQDVQNIIPESVTINPNDGYLTFNTTPIVAHLVKAFQDMQQQINEKNTELALLKQEIELLKTK